MARMFMPGDTVRLVKLLFHDRARGLREGDRGTATEFGIDPRVFFWRARQEVMCLNSQLEKVNG